MISTFFFSKILLFEQSVIQFYLKIKHQEQKTKKKNSGY